MLGEPDLSGHDGLVAPLMRNPRGEDGGSAGGRFPPASAPASVLSESGRRRSPLTSVCPFILGNELCERMAYYGLSTNLVVYFQEVLDLSTAEANMQVNIWMGTCYVTPILGAIMADSYLGRYKTIMVFSSIYLVGLLLLVATNVTCDQTSLDLNKMSFMLFVALYIISLGTGGIKPNVSSFGADQFNDDDPVQKKEKESFFNWFYMFINIGSMISSTVVVYVQEQISWTIGFIIPAVCMFFATWIFFIGRRRYVRVKPAESPILRVFKVLLSATGSKKKEKAYIHSRIGESDASKIPHNQSYQWLESAVNIENDDEGNVSGGDRNPLLSSSTAITKKQKKQYSHDQVQEVRLVVRLFPLFLATCFYWTVYSQMQTLFVSQGMQMNTLVKFSDSVSIEIPPASLSSFDTISILTLIPVYDQGLLPLLKYFNRKITVLQRIGWGLLLASLSMVAAGLVEMQRLKLASEGKFTEGGDKVDMSVFWQSFQYLLVGASEVFAAIGQLELFYDQAPDSMRSCCSALALLSTAIGGYTAGALIPIVNKATSKWGKWIPSDLNQGHLDYFFFSIAILNTLNFFYFLIVASRFKYKEVPHGTSSSVKASAGSDGHLSERTPLLAGNMPQPPVMIPPRAYRPENLERTPIRSLMTQNLSPVFTGPLR
jgi:peptide/histidine transporter 3/4